MEKVKRVMSHSEAISIASLWAEVEGNPSIDLAGQEPTLWGDKDKNIADLAKSLKNIPSNNGKEFKVAMTTNGYRLHKYAEKLAKANIDKVRISWHTCSDKVFKQISGGKEYQIFRKSLNRAVKTKLPIVFNRVLMKNYTNDVPEQLQFVEENNLTLKLYDLYWTSQLDNYYKGLYIHWKDIVKDYVMPRSTQTTNIDKDLTRSRYVFHLKKGGSVVVKGSASCNAKKDICLSCKHKDNCLEGFLDYLRVDTDLNAYPCYLRKDLSFSFKEVLESKSPKDELIKKFKYIFKIGKTALKETKLRYLLTSFCNFKCLIPGTNVSWCLAKG